MSKQVKIQWPFPKGKLAQLVWIGSPFRFEKKIMIHAYFRSDGVTKKIMMDWGDLPFLAIQHYYRDGIISESSPIDEFRELEITIHPNETKYHEKTWKIQGTNDTSLSQSFTFSQKGKYIVLPIIEVIRSIIAPNSFLLYRLFELNSFPQYFTESYEKDNIHLHFTSQYELKYTKLTFIYQLVWLLTNQDIRKIFENLAFTWFQERALKFEWNFDQPIMIKARVKEKDDVLTILQILNVKNKYIPIKHISISHPEIQEREQSNEAKKYTYRRLVEDVDSETLTLDDTLDGSTEKFDLIQMNQQLHEYSAVPKITKVKGKRTKHRTREDENTKKYYGDAGTVRSTADVGGQNLARGIEHQMLHEVQTQGELQDFINILKLLEQNSEVGSIQVMMNELPEGKNQRKFLRLSDGITIRKYIIAQINMVTGVNYHVIEVERESRSLSTLILSSKEVQDWKSIYQLILLDLVNAGGSWSSKSLGNIQNKDITVMKSKHSQNNIGQRAKSLLVKLLTY